MITFNHSTLYFSLAITYVKKRFAYLQWKKQACEETNYRFKTYLARPNDKAKNLLSVSN